MNFLDELGCDNSVHCSGFSDQMAGNCGLPVPHAARVSVLQYPPALQYLGLALVPALTSFNFRLVDSCSSAVLQYPPALQYLGLGSCARFDPTHPHLGFSVDYDVQLQYHHRGPGLLIDEQDLPLLLAYLVPEQQQRLVSLQQLSGSSSGTEQQHAVGDRFAAAVENKPYV